MLSGEVSYKKETVGTMGGEPRSKIGYHTMLAEGKREAVLRKHRYLQYSILFGKNL